MLFVVVALLAAAPWRAPRSAEPAARRTTHSVTVNLTCGDDTDDWVSDSSLEVMRGDTIDWVLTPASNVTKFKVKRKNKNLFWIDGWPFRRRDLDSDSTANNRVARGNDMRPDVKKGVYSYEIIGKCQGPDEARIDPDIIIDF
ncbi:MAG: hypothetical protein C0503_04440 [Gemmatimonas sp.]|nr:hypothetical protein [Gemmatimonas sp.]